MRLKEKSRRTPSRLLLVFIFVDEHVYIIFSVNNNVNNNVNSNVNNNVDSNFFVYNNVDRED